MLGKGIILLAFGHPYYGRMAYNLAATIKAAENIPIAVARTGSSLSHLSKEQNKVFDYHIDLPASAPLGFAAKLHMDELTPFEQTLFLDADMLWVTGKKPTELFEEFGDVEFSAITEGWYDLDKKDDSNVNPKYIFWAELDEIISTYNLTKGKIYQWRSEVMYFRKTEKVKRLFADSREVLQQDKLTTVHKFGTLLPDELGLNIAAAINDMHPHKVKWTPAYWHTVHGRIPTATELNRWYLASFGSNSYSGSIMKFYDSIIKPALSRMGRQHVFRLISKKSFLAERIKF